MFSSLTRSRRRSRPTHKLRSTLMGLECLEHRDCPSDGGLPGGSESGSGGESSHSTAYISFNYSHGPNKMVVIDGTVTDENPSYLPVTFSGVVQGLTYTDAQGHFSIELPASSLGAFRAQTIDHEGYESNVYEDTLTNVAPTITVSARLSPGGWVIEGNVGDEHTDGLVVRFTSSIPQVNGRTATVQEGPYGIVVSNSNISGDLRVSVTDWWGEVASADYYI